MHSPAHPGQAELRGAPRQRYLALALVQVQRAIAYPGATLLEILASLLSVAIIYYLWKSVFAAQPQIGSFDWPRMRTYVVLVYVIGALMDTAKLRSMMHAIRTGE